MEKVYSWIQQNYSEKPQVERDYIFLRMMGAFNYGEDGFVDGFKDLAPKAYDFIKNLQDKNNTMKDY